MGEFDVDPEMVGFMEAVWGAKCVQQFGFLFGVDCGGLRSIIGIMGFVVSDIHMNPAGICHGGVMMTLMDMAVGMNVQLAAETETFSPTIQMSFDFLKPAYKDEWLFSEINFRHTTRRMGFASGLLIGPNGPVVRCNGIAKLPNANDKRFAQAEGAAAFKRSTSNT